MIISGRNYRNFFENVFFIKIMGWLRMAALVQECLEHHKIVVNVNCVAGTLKHMPR